MPAQGEAERRTRGEFYLPGWLVELMSHLAKPRPGERAVLVTPTLTGDILRALPPRGLVVAQYLPHPNDFAQDGETGWPPFEGPRAGFVTQDLSELTAFIRAHQPAHVVVSPDYPIDPRPLRAVPSDLLSIPPRASLIEALVAIGVGSLADDRAIIALVLQGLLASRSKAAFRQVLLDRCHLQVLMEMENPLLPETAINLALIRAVARPAGTVTLLPSRIYRLTSPPEDVAALALDCLADDRPRLGIQAVITDPTAPITYRRLEPRVAEVQQFYADRARIVKLGDLFQLKMGLQIGQPGEAGKEMVEVPIVRGRDLASGVLVVSELETVAVPQVMVEQARLQLDDVLLATLSREHRACVIDEALAGAVAGPGVLILRPRQASSAISRYVVNFLNSETGQFFTERWGTGATFHRLSPAEVAELPVPLFEEDIRGQLDELGHLEQTIRRQADEARLARLALFSIDTRAGLEERLARLRTHAAILSDSINRAGDLRFRIRNFYPFAISYTYRGLDTELDPTLRYKEQLRCGENILAFLASVGLVLVGPRLKELPGDFQEVLRRGISPGHWLGLVRETARLLKHQDTEPDIPEFPYIWWRRAEKDKASPFSRQLEKVVALKNDYKHDRGPKTPEEHENAAKQLQALLDEVLAGLDFLTRYPLLLVRDSAAQLHSDQHRIKYLLCMGDHPAFSPGEMEYSSALVRDQLYLQNAEGNLHLTYPFIIADRCPQCRLLETFFLDSWDKDAGRVQLKSFERGHTLQSEAVYDHLARLLT
ncbi:MAG: hypothetical protein E3J21_06060 [Anaerolineales bacterium]|nr:MAG: hypothetical protein E3J21_06060 [Anaerolineales bacterium]